MWKPKYSAINLIAHTFVRVFYREDLYFDSSYSRHMTEEKTYLEMIKSYTNSYVTFGDGAKVRIKGMGKLIYPSLPSLDNVLLIEGLTSNLISIIQLCNQGLKVRFNKLKYFISSQGQELVMKGTRSKDNSICGYLTTNETL